MKPRLLIAVENDAFIAFDLTKGCPDFIARDVVLESEGLGYFVRSLAFERFLAQIESHFKGKKSIPTVLGLDGNQVVAIPAELDPALEPYQLEQVLPIDAENMAVRSNGQVVLVAMRNRILPIMESLAETRLEVVRVTPLDLLISEALLKQRGAEANGQQLMVWVRHAWFENEEPVSTGSKVVFRDGAVVDWESFVEERAPTKRTVGRSLQDVAPVENVLELEVVEPENGLILCEAGLREGAGDRYDFTDDFSERLVEQEKGAAGMLLLAILVFLLSTAGAVLLRQQQFHREADRIEETTHRAFRKALPELGRTRLYKRKLDAAIKKYQETGEWIESNSATIQILQGLKEFLAALPSDIRFETKSLRLTGQQIVFEGKTKTVQDLNRLRDALSSSPILRVSDLSFGVDFILTFDLEFEEVSP